MLGLTNKLLEIINLFSDVSLNVQDPNPEAISQDLLDRSGKAYLDGDADAFVACFAFPHRIITFDAVRVVPDEQTLRDVFMRLRRHFQSQGLTDIVRPCIQATFINHDTIQATHESRYLAGTRLIQRPSVGLSTIRRYGEVWRVVDGQYAIQDAPDHIRALMDPGKDRRAEDG